MLDQTLQFAVQEPASLEGEQSPTVVMLHGYGSHEGDLLPIGQMLDPRLLTISPRAPIDLAPFGMFGGYAWFHLTQRPDGEISYDEEGALKAVALVGEFLDQVRQRPDVDPERLFLMGFSQGAMLTHGIVLTDHIPLAGAIACSGRMVESVFTPARDLADRAGFPLFVCHGVADELIPVESGRAIRDYYENTPIYLTYREYPIGHGIDETGILDIRRWLAPKLSPAETGS